MKAKFNAAAAARFGSGWAWLGLKSDGGLTITTTANQDNPLQARRLRLTRVVSIGVAHAAARLGQAGSCYERAAAQRVPCGWMHAYAGTEQSALSAEIVAVM